jgi:hypothetical protein
MWTSTEVGLRTGGVRFFQMLIFLLISTVWLVVTALVVAMCRMAGSADRAELGQPRRAVQARPVQTAPEAQRAGDQTGVSGLRLAGHSRRLPAASA